MAKVYEPDTPISDMLYTVTGGEPLATWNRHRGSGGEWDTLRETPIRVRRSLTSAGFLAANGILPDVFTDMLRRYGPSDVEPDPIAWFVRIARMAIQERRQAHRKGLETAIARASGHTTYFEYRDALATAEGYASYWHRRKAKGWT